MKVRIGGSVYSCDGCKKEFVARGRKNSPKRYCSKACAAKMGGGLKGMTGPNHHSWNGGRNVIRGGYIEIWAPEHPNARGGKYVREHRLVMEKFLGRFLKDTEQVHHRNGIKDDNRIKNLELITDIHLGKVECPHCQKTFSVR